MPLKVSDIEKYSIKIAEKNEVFVWVGPCSSKKMSFDVIPLDGRKYECGGTIILANGLDLQASFRIIKSTNEPLLIDDSIYTKIDDVWYKLGEPEFYAKTELDPDDVFPIEWLPDIPLELSLKGPYRMDLKG
jgi:hypothetical protein